MKAQHAARRYTLKLWLSLNSPKVFPTELARILYLNHGSQHERHSRNSTESREPSFIEGIIIELPKIYDA